jgi:hypothetical protein
VHDLIGLWNKRGSRTVLPNRREAGMKFAKRVFLGAGIWGVVVLTPFYFLFDAIGRQGPAPINYPQFYYGFLAVAMGVAIRLPWDRDGSGAVPMDDAPEHRREARLLSDSGVLYLQGRITSTDALVIPPDLLLGVLFVVAFAKTSGS